MITAIDAIILYFVVLASILTAIVLFSKLTLTLLLQTLNKLADQKIIKLRNVARSLLGNMTKKFNIATGGQGGDMMSTIVGMGMQMLANSPKKPKGPQGQSPMVPVRSL